MKRSLFFTIVICCVFLVATSGLIDAVPGDKPVSKKDKTAKLCGQCGHIKGTADCCKIAKKEKEHKKEHDHKHDHNNNME